MKIFKYDEHVANGVPNTHYPEMILFEGVTTDCIKDLVSEAERVRASIDATYFDEHFPSGLPNKLDVTLSGSAGTVETKDFPLIPEATDYTHELTSAVRLATRWILSTMSQRSSTPSWTVCAKFIRDEQPRTPGASDEKPCVYEVGM